MGKGKAETGRDREGEGDVVLLVAFIEVLLVALRCTYGSVDGLMMIACGLDC